MSRYPVSEDICGETGIFCQGSPILAELDWSVLQAAAQVNKHEFGSTCTSEP